VLKIQTVTKTSRLKRRHFLSNTVALGGVALLSTSTGAAYAVGTTTESNDAFRKLQPNNATVNDFTDLVGQKFSLQVEGGLSVRAKLIEANSPQTRHALRFRRAHFSIVFDVPVGQELIQGQYQLSHPRIGSMDLFMSPVDLPEKYNRLEAVFT
jgi:hypothetical protein